MRPRFLISPLPELVVAAMVWGVAVHNLSPMPRPDVVQEMQVALPLFVQVGMTAGDRYLAANISGFRALLASTYQMKPDNFKIQGLVQQDVAWLNPAHEDNYYIAAAILPWNGQLDAAQDVLQRATAARPNDWTPIFYYAFDLYYFKHDALGAAQAMVKAEGRATDEQDRYAITSLAARWFEKGYQPKVAVGVIEAMAAQARSGGFKKYLQTRVARLKMLNTLQDAAQQYRQRTGRPLHDLNELVSAGLIDTLPVDPFGMGFGVDAQGQPILFDVPPARRAK